MKHLFTIAAMFLAGGLSSTFATSYVFNFSPSGPGHDVGPTENYTAGGATIVASGWLVAGGATDLYQKYTAGQSYETGLGITADPDHEVPPPYFVQLDVSDLIAKGFDWVSFKLGSLQANEQANIYGIATSGTLGGATLLTTLVGKPLEQTWGIALTGKYLYFGITGGGTAGADPVIESATTRVPDGGSVVLLLASALLAVAGSRKFRVVRSA
jgi:hypothetical protein